ncbi:MAG: hypothetical protein V3W51_04760 [Candidatus Brocadiales bacterium]
MQHLYIGQWNWATDPEEGSQWEMPRADIGLGLLDLRSLPQCGTPGPTPQGYGLFVLSEQDNTIGRYLGDSLGTLVTAPQRQELGTVFKLGEQIVSTNVLGVILELFGPHADPSGQARWKPLRGSARGGYGLYLAGQHLKWRYEEFDEAYRRQGLEVDRLDWLELKAANLLSGSEHYRRVLTGLAEKYGITPDALLQKWGESWVQAWPRETQYNESFDTADSDTLGPDLTWTEPVGDIDIVSNKASGQGSQESRARAEHDLSTDDHYAQALISGLIGSPDRGGACARYASAADTGYLFRLRDSAAATWQMAKFVTGTITQLDKLDGTAPGAAAHTEKLQVNASALEGFHDGSSKISLSDATITGNVRGGITLKTDADNRAKADDFEIADLAAAGVEIFRRRIEGY